MPRHSRRLVLVVDDEVLIDKLVDIARATGLSVESLVKKILENIVVEEKKDTLVFFLRADKECSELEREVEKLRVEVKKKDDIIQNLKVQLQAYMNQYVQLLTRMEGASNPCKTFVEALREHNLLPLAKKLVEGIVDEQVIQEASKYLSEDAYYEIQYCGNEILEAEQETQGKPTRLVWII